VWFDDVWFSEKYKEKNRINTEDELREFLNYERTKCEVFYYIGRKKNYQYFMYVNYDSPYSDFDPDTDEIYDFCGPLMGPDKILAELITTRINMPFTTNQEEWIRVDLSKFISINSNKTSPLTAEAAPHP